jgi:hypothetical protein
VKDKAQGRRVDWWIDGFVDWRCFTLGAGPRCSHVAGGWERHGGEEVIEIFLLRFGLIHWDSLGFTLIHFVSGMVLVCLRA